MKKIVFVFLSSLFLFGCNKNYENELKAIGNDYYNSYIKGKVNGLDTVEITLRDLKKLKNIDLSSVKSCSDKTKIVMQIKNNNIEKYEIEQDCK